MQEFELLSLSHFLGFCICLAAIVFIPKLIQAKPGLENFSKYLLIFLLVENQIRSTYVETLIKGGNLLENLPLHLCDFSAIVIAVFLLTDLDLYSFLHIFGELLALVCLY